jgi:hypothetical protein
MYKNIQLKKKKLNEEEVSEIHERDKCKKEEEFFT